MKWNSFIKSQQDLPRKNDSKSRIDIRSQLDNSNFSNSRLSNTKSIFKSCEKQSKTSRMKRDSGSSNNLKFMSEQRNKKQSTQAPKQFQKEIKGALKGFNIESVDHEKIFSLLNQFRFLMEQLLQKYLQKMEQIVPKKQTANKLIKYFTNILILPEVDSIKTQISEFNIENNNLNSVQRSNKSKKNVSFIEQKDKNKTQSLKVSVVEFKKRIVLQKNQIEKITNKCEQMNQLYDQKNSNILSNHKTKRKTQRKSRLQNSKNQSIDEIIDKSMDSKRKAQKSAMKVRQLLFGVNKLLMQ